MPSSGFASEVCSPEAARLCWRGYLRCSYHRIHDNQPSAARDIAANSDTLILVDEADRNVGYLSKMQCHQGRGVLHRAFSLLIFNGSGSGRCTGQTAAAAIHGARRVWRPQLSVAFMKN
jgi:hypothetical protein